MNTTGFHHLALTVSDADASARWYANLLGLEEVLRGDDETVSFRLLAGPDLMLGVRCYHGHPSDRFSEFRTGIDHLAFGVRDRDELQAWERRLAEHDVTYTPIADTPIGSVIVFRDLDGIQLEFWLPAAEDRTGPPA
jgi:glyoxylase I family protein